MHGDCPSLVHEEGLPCLLPQDKPLPGDSNISEAFSSVSTRRADHCRRFILLFLLLAILSLAVLIAFILGQYISEWGKEGKGRGDDQQRRIVSNNDTYHYKSSIAPPTATMTTSTSTSKTTSTDSTPFHSERLIPLVAVKNLTLEEVFVSYRDDDEEWTEMSHSTDVKSERDTLLVPLSQSIRPTQYHLQVDITRFSDTRTISANITIHLMSYGNSSDEEIVFHAGPELRINRIRLKTGEENLSIISIKQELNKKLYRLLLKERLRRAEYILEMEYTVKICEAPLGGVNCYIEPSMIVNGKAFVSSFTTKFEPALARSFLPCWDEPAVKAVFQLEVLHESHIKVLSNTGILWTKNVSETTTLTSFHQTPPMSSYLLALAAGDFVKLEVQTKRKIPVTIWTFPDDLARATFAAKFTPLMFDQQEEELEVLYPLSKLDLVAARSFPVGAMENWGLVVFDSQTLLQQSELDDSMVMTVDRHHHEYRIAKIITHEIAHQWFGNLVTMSDWSELWLNEGFATFFVYEQLSALYPQLTDHEYLNRLALLMHKQSGLERPSLVRSLQRESQVEAAFHTTHLYTKGCVVVRMIRDLISPDDFSIALRRYVRNNAFGAVKREDLFASFPVYADHGAENVRLDEVMESWLINEGMPEVTVSRKYDTDGIRVTQRLSRANRYRIFLYEDKGAMDADTYSFTDNTYNSDEVGNIRNRRSIPDPSKEFDDSLFESLPEEYTKKKKKKTTQKKRTRHRQKNIHQHKTRKSSGIWVERREEDLKGRKQLSPSDKWSIPFSYMFGSLKSSEGQVIRQFWLRNRTIAFTDVEVSSTAPLLANPNWAFPYRVNYDYANWKMIARLLHDDHNVIPLKSRMQLISDAEFFLSQSGLPHLYIYLLGYLHAEESLPVCLMGLDAIHRVIETFQGTSIVHSLIKYLTPSISNMDRQLRESQLDIELASLWLVDAHRLTRIYQLRCAANLTSCEEEKEVREWFQRGHYTEDMHQKTTALCHYMATQGGGKEASRIEGDLEKAKVDPTTLQLSTCVRDSPSLAATAAKIVVAQRNAAVYDSVLRSDLSQQHYNFVFRRALWTAIGALSENDKKFLFSIEESVPSPKSVSLLHAIRSTTELQLVKSLLPSWGRMAVHLQFLSKQLSWQERVADGVLAKFLSNDTPTI